MYSRKHSWNAVEAIFLLWEDYIANIRNAKYASHIRDCLLIQNIWSRLHLVERNSLCVPKLLRLQLKDWRTTDARKQKKRKYTNHSYICISNLLLAFFCVNECRMTQKSDRDQHVFAEIGDRLFFAMVDNQVCVKWWSVSHCFEINRLVCRNFRPVFEIESSAIRQCHGCQSSHCSSPQLREWESEGRAAPFLDFAFKNVSFQRGTRWKLTKQCCV